MLYLWGLGASGWANSYYSMAVQAGTKSWKAFFFGSLDSANSITVDKSPASLWVMELSARIFGVNSWSILVPQALEGVACVGLLYAAVKRWFGPPAALLAGAVMALTPVAALMFRFNNPDALLVLVPHRRRVRADPRAREGPHAGGSLLAFSFVGFGFLAKMLQALIVVPAFALVYLIAGPPQLGKRVVQLRARRGRAARVGAVGGSWPCSCGPRRRVPYIGGSQNNSLWNVIFGYNGFGRLTGNETGSVVGGGQQGAAGQWGPTGWLRMFNAQFGGQASWLIPAALIVLVAGLDLHRRACRAPTARAPRSCCGAAGWWSPACAFSLGQGIIHPYYTVALAPAIGALVGIGGTRLWSGRSHPAARVVLAIGFAATVWWSYTLLGRTPNWNAGAAQRACSSRGDRHRPLAGRARHRGCGARRGVIAASAFDHRARRSGRVHAERPSRPRTAARSRPRARRRANAFGPGGGFGNRAFGQRFNGTANGFAANGFGGPRRSVGFGGPPRNGFGFGARGSGRGRRRWWRRGGLLNGSTLDAGHDRAA